MLLKLAWRNIWRNRRRTIITIVAVVFATLLSITMRGFQLGTYEVNINYALNLISGYIQLQRTGYQDSPTLQKSFSFDEKIRATVTSQPKITGSAPRLTGEGLISFRDKSFGVAIIGIDPVMEKNVTRILERIISGAAFSSDTTDGIIIGTKLRENLGVEVGDTVVVLGQGFDGTLCNQKFRIVGTMKTGVPEMDTYTVFMGLHSQQNLFAMGNRISFLSIGLPSLEDIQPVTDALNAKLDTPSVRALTWEEVMPSFKQSIELDNISGMFFLGILIVVVAFGILNAVLMSVTERFREFGIMLSVGMQQRSLVVVVLFETVFITFIGIMIGSVLAYFVNAYFAANPIQFTGDYATMMEEYGFLPQMPSIVKVSSFLNTTLSIVVISLISVIYPLYRVSRLEPLKGIRYT